MHYMWLTDDEMCAHESGADPGSEALGLPEVIQEVQEEDSEREEHSIQYEHDKEGAKTYRPPPAAIWRHRQGKIAEVFQISMVAIVARGTGFNLGGYAQVIEALGWEFTTDCIGHVVILWWRHWTSGDLIVVILGFIVLWG